MARLIILLLDLTRNSQAEHNIEDLKERIQSFEEGQTQLLDKLNSAQKKSKGTIHSVTAKSLTKKKPSKVSCDLSLAKFSYPSMLQKYRKQAHKAPYNI